MSQNTAGSVADIAKAVVKAMGKQLPSKQADLGDDKLNQARDLVTSEVQSMVDENDIRVIEEKITYAREVKIELNTKSGFQKLIHARQYHKLAKGIYGDAKLMSERAYDQFQFHPQQGTSSEADNIYRTTQAQSLYRCWLSCRDAFPSSLTQEDWVRDVWKEFKCGSMELLNDMKTKTKSAVESSYEFDSSHAPQIISRNASRAQALLAETTFIYQETNFDGRPRYPYRHPIIQKVVNKTWFQNNDDIGIIFHDYFAPIPFEAIALVLTVIECCIGEWSTGTCKESSWREVHYEANYMSHLNSLRDLHNCGPDRKGRDLLRGIQDDLLKDARIHAGATPHPTTGPGKLSINALEAAVQDDPPKYESD
ncbi:hypothetical protein V8E52_006345 [Russula decolorans]